MLSVAYNSNNTFKGKYLHNTRKMVLSVGWDCAVNEVGGNGMQLYRVNNGTSNDMDFRTI